MAQVTQAPINSAALTGLDSPLEERGAAGLVSRLMSALIRTLAWSKLSKPKVAITVSGAGLMLSMFVGATAPNAETLAIRLPLSTLLSSLSYSIIIATAILYTGVILACLGLAGMLWAHSQGWQPNPRRLLMAGTAVAAVMVSLTPVGSSDTGSYAAYGRIAAQGGNPYTTSPQAWGDHSYTYVVGAIWKQQPSVYGPIATAVQRFAATIGGANVATTIWILMILNGAVFIGVGWLLLKTSDDPVRATLLWTANPVLIQQLVGGGHLDTFVAAAAICAIQLARRSSSIRGDALVAILVGLACGVKIYAVLIGAGLVWPLLRSHEWKRVILITAVSGATLALEYSFYGLGALKPLFGGLRQVTLPSPSWSVEKIGLALHASHTTTATIISCLWPIALIVVAWFIQRRISSDQPQEVVWPFALTFAWVLVAPWVFAWYTAVAWAALTQVPRNRMTRWLAIVTVFLALCLSSGGQSALGK
jgi:hypothetical protein